MTTSTFTVTLPVSSPDDLRLRHLVAVVRGFGGTIRKENECRSTPPQEEDAGKEEEELARAGSSSSNPPAKE